MQGDTAGENAIIHVDMDWNSPTTKKHIAEAQAQGCELVGSGRSNNHRLYRLECGHEQDVQVGNMRKAKPICKSCEHEKRKAEAKAQGCVLISSGVNRNYRTYRLPCGHQQEVQTSKMREGGFRCRTCIEDRLIDEAKQRNCEIVSRGTTPNFRFYRLPCGHMQEVQPSHMRRGAFQCQICLHEKLKVEAQRQDCELIGAGSNKKYRNYRLPCGHEQEIQVAKIRVGNFRCVTCHESMLGEEAKIQGCKLLGLGKSGDFRNYLLSCGHEQEIQPSNMRRGNFRCQSCEEYSFTQPSQAYLLHIKVDADEWLKLGYAKDVDFRTSRYGLPSEAEVNVLATIPFDTGKEAQEFEQSLHKKYRQKKLSAKDMLAFHTGSGATECYPLTMVEQLMSEMKADS